MSILNSCTLVLFTLFLYIDRLQVSSFTNEFQFHRAAIVRPLLTGVSRQRSFDRSSTYFAIKSSPQLVSVEGDFSTDENAATFEKGSIKAYLRAFYKFCRPHTIRGTLLASIAGTVRALLDTPGAFSNAKWGTMLPRAFIGMLALLLGNAFIVGINQIYDVGIDKMNKPFLPVASGEMSSSLAWAIVLFCGTVGPVLVYNFFPKILFKLYMMGWTLGAIYSVPPIRTKRNPIAAGLTIATVRGFLLNFGVYYAVSDAIGAKFLWSPKVSFIARFMTVFATVIAVTKDLPDTEGDKAFQIETFATNVGVSRLAKGASAVLLLNYVHAMLTGILNRNAFNIIPMVAGHALLAAGLVARFSELDPESIPSIKKYYKHIWDLFYLEYFLYTLI